MYFRRSKDPCTRSDKRTRRSPVGPTASPEARYPGGCAGAQGTEVLNSHGFFWYIAAFFVGRINRTHVHRTRVKICGITRREDGLLAAGLGADAVGLVFYRPSPRFVEPGQARAIRAALPPFVTVVGLFVNAGADQVAAATEQVELDLLQFHGDEEPEFCGQFRRPYIKAIRMRDNADPRREAARYPQAAGFLLDAYRPGVPGGTGETFDWDRVPLDLGRPLILAGGLDPANVAEAIRRTRPYGVDVSGGVEAVKGVKDSDKMLSFIRGVASVHDD